MARRTRGDTGRRLRDGSPGLYRTIAPVARTVRRSLDVALDTVDVSRARISLGPPLERRDAPAPRVVLDGCAFQERSEGIARVWTALMSEWSRSGFSEHVTVLDRGATAPRMPGFTYMDLPPIRAFDTKTQRRLLEEVCRRERADLFVSTLYSTPETTRSLLCVLDLTPEVLGWDLDRPIWREKRRAVERASAYVCISQSTAADLQHHYPVTRGRPVDVALLGVDPAFRPSPDEEICALRERLDLPERYFVFMGHRDDYKNADLLFRTLPLFGEDPGFGLLLVGGAPQLEPAFAEAARHITVRIARLPDESLRAAFSGAAALLYLSRYEGFGLPVIEAMACGCPVISTGGSSLPEATGTASLVVDEDDPVMLGDAMRRVAEPQVRRDLIARGREWSAAFRWDRTAGIVRTAIERAALRGTPASAAPLVSILTPSLDQAAWLPDNLRSVACQTYEPIEHVVMDGGSTDGSVEMLADSGDGVRWWTGPDTGQSDAINKAFRESTGEIIGWINSDDAYFDCSVVEDVVACFAAHPEVDVVFGHCAQVDERGTIIWLNWVPPFSRRLLKIVNFIGQPVTFIRRSALSDPMLDETFHFAMDYELWLRLEARGCRFHRIDRITAVDRHQAARKSETIKDVLHADLDRLADSHGRGYPRGKRILSWGFYAWRRAMGATLIGRIPEHLAFTDVRTSKRSIFRRQLLSWNKAWPTDWKPER